MTVVNIGIRNIEIYPLVQKTLLQDFLEKYPNTPLGNDGTPLACPYLLGYVDEKGCHGDCIDCWNQPDRRLLARFESGKIEMDCVGKGDPKRIQWLNRRR